MKRVVLWAVSFFAVLPLFADARYTSGPVFHDYLITQVADVDGDGLDDIVGCNIYLNRGGSFSPPIAVPQLSDTQHDRLLIAIDVNDDHFVDLIVGRTQDNSALQEGLIRIYTGDGHGGFQESSRFKSLPLAWDRPVDFDGDGRVDLLRVGKGPIRSHHSAFELLRNNGDGTFTATQTVEVDESARGFLMADLDGDRRLDLVAISDMNLIVWYGSGNGRFGPAIMRYMPFVASLAAADVNADGAADLVMLSWLPSDRLVVVYGDGLGHFSGVASTPVPQLSGDGDQFAIAGKEIVLSQYDGTLVSYSAASGHLEIVDQLVTGFTNLSLMLAHFNSPASADFLVGSMRGYEPQQTVMFGRVVQASLIDNPIRSRGRRAVARRVSTSSGPVDGKFQVTLTSPGLEPIVDTWHLQQEAIFVTQTNGRPDTRVDAATIENSLWIHLENAQNKIEGFSTIEGNRITGTMRGSHDVMWDFTAVRQ